jgi:hypothetical protein
VSVAQRDTRLAQLVGVGAQPAGRRAQRVGAGTAVDQLGDVLGAGGRGRALRRRKARRRRQCRRSGHISGGHRRRGAAERRGVAVFLGRVLAGIGTQPCARHLRQHGGEAAADRDDRDLGSDRVGDGRRDRI